MLTELQGATHPIPAPQARAAVLVSTTVQPTQVGRDVHSSDSGIHTSNSEAAPKVQAPKPVDIKVDVEKMRADLKESIDKMNQVMRDGGRNLNFSMDEKLGGLVILVKNADTGEVVRQIPNDAVVRMAHSIEEFKGLLLNELS